MKIKHLKLDCANLGELRYFYTKKFKFEIVEEGDGELCLKAGDSLLTFSENRLKKPYYHFAFNIPYTLVDKALAWVKKKVDVLPTDDGDIQEFASWRARSIYFHDPAGNIVEFIGRQEFGEAKNQVFNESKVLNISEVGLPVFEVSSAFKGISKATGIKKFDCIHNTFCAAGDDEGLLIIVDKAEKRWFPTDSPAKDYNLEINLKEGENSFLLQHMGGELNIRQIRNEKT